MLFLLLRWKQSISSVQFSHSVVSDSLRPHESQHARPPCPSPTPGGHSDSRPSSQWCHPSLSSSVVPFYSCPQSFEYGMKRRVLPLGFQERCKTPGTKPETRQLTGGPWGSNFNFLYLLASVNLKILTYREVISDTWYRWGAPTYQPK